MYYLCIINNIPSSVIAGGLDIYDINEYICFVASLTSKKRLNSLMKDSRMR